MLHTDFPRTGGRRFDLIAQAEVEHASVAERMADLMIDRVDRGGCTDKDLLEQGFAPQDIAEYADAARKLAHTMFWRQDDKDAPPPRTARDGALLISGLFPRPDMIIFTLQENGWTNSEIAAEWDEMMALAGDRFAALPPHGKARANAEGIKQ